MEETIKKKKRVNKVAKGTEPYDQFETLIEILRENKSNKKVTLKEKVYLFNELDLMLSEGVDIKLLIKGAKYRHGGLDRVSTYANFNVDKANWIEATNEFLQELEMNLQEGKIATKYEFYVDGKIIVPTKEQEQLVKDYLKQNNIVLNEMTYSLALRRLIIGGDVQSKFDKNYFIERTYEHKREQESTLSV